jgi:iron complex outermembrane receptor protein
LAQEAPVLLDAIDVNAARTGLQLTQPSAAGSRLNLTPMQTPASVEIISGETIREHGEHRIADAVTQNSTGITAAPAPGNGGVSFTSRGFSGVGSVMTLFDGTRLYVSSGTVTFPFDTWSTDHIEVLRGPASVLYGEGAIGGVINVVPKKPFYGDTHGGVEAAFDSHVTPRLGLDLGGSIDPYWSYRFNLSGNRSNGWVNRGENAGGNLSAALQFQPRGDITITLREDYGDQLPQKYFGTPLINGGISPNLRYQNYNVGDASIHYQDNLTQLKAQWTVVDGLVLENNLYGVTSDRHWYDVENYAFVPATGTIKRTNYIEIYHVERQFGDRASASFHSNLMGLKNDLLVGGDVNLIDFRHINNSPYSGTSSVSTLGFDPGTFMNVAGTALKWHSYTRAFSLFAEDRLALSDQFSIVLGGRFDVPDIQRADYLAATSFEKSFHQPTWRVGMVFTPIPSLAFYAQYATAVDPVSNLVSLSVSNKDFLLSTGKQIEVGVKRTFWDGRGEFTLASYQLIKNNLLTVDPLNPNITNQIGQQSSRGIEAALALNFAESWRVDANLAVLRAKYDNYTQAAGGASVSFAGRVPTNIPQQVGNLWVNWGFAPGWEARVGLQAVGKRYGDAANTALQPAYALLNAMIEWKMTQQASMTLRGYNLTDKIYATSGNTTAWVLGPSRTFELALNVKF